MRRNASLSFLDMASDITRLADMVAPKHGLMSDFSERMYPPSLGLAHGIESFARRLGDDSFATKVGSFAGLGRTSLADAIVHEPFAVRFGLEHLGRAGTSLHDQWSNLGITNALAKVGDLGIVRIDSMQCLVERVQGPKFATDFAAAHRAVLGSMPDLRTVRESALGLGFQDTVKQLVGLSTLADHIGYAERFNVGLHHVLRPGPHELWDQHLASTVIPMAHMLSFASDAPYGLLTGLAGGRAGASIAWLKETAARPRSMFGAVIEEEDLDGNDQPEVVVEATVTCWNCDTDMLHSDQTFFWAGPRRLHIDMRVFPFCITCMKALNEDPGLLARVYAQFTGRPPHPRLRLISGGRTNDAPKIRGTRGPWPRIVRDDD